jgi:DNA/RNA-binding domain of Phe-tRNA-synthetase-like protein
VRLCGVALSYAGTNLYELVRVRQRGRYLVRFRIASPTTSQELIVNGNNWRQLYRSAILEINIDKLGKRVKTAEEAILYRVLLDSDIPRDERVVLKDAVNALSILKRERL